MAAKTETYIALVGLNYPTAKGEVRVEAGKPCADLPAKSVAWLRSQGLIQAGKGAPADPEPVAEDAPEEADD